MKEGSSMKSGLKTKSEKFLQQNWETKPTHDLQIVHSTLITKTLIYLKNLIKFVVPESSSQKEDITKGKASTDLPQLLVSLQKQQFHNFRTLPQDQLSTTQRSASLFSLTFALESPEIIVRCKSSTGLSTMAAPFLTTVSCPFKTQKQTLKCLIETGSCLISGIRSNMCSLTRTQIWSLSVRCQTLLQPLLIICSDLTVGRC